ncbi:hypothetical protein WA026_021624 [Henosepilachna vigintioctopunctata]|uniref:Uncharacterized protein n=1 Tax=Henosepilachna vigintioctopunctata TaxID=420089 RepID=A0AAW1V563_9CUCU
MLQANKCPECSKNLEFKQINMNMAVEICVDLNCKYPVGGKCRVINRKLGELAESPGAIETDPQIANQKMQVHIPQKTDTPSEISSVQQNQFVEELDTFLSNIFENTIQSTVMQPAMDCTNDSLNLSNSNYVPTDVLDKLFDEFDRNFK